MDWTTMEHASRNVIDKKDREIDKHKKEKTTLRKQKSKANAKLKETKRQLQECRQEKNNLKGQLDDEIKFRKQLEQRLGDRPIEKAQR